MAAMKRNPINPTAYQRPKTERPDLPHVVRITVSGNAAGVSHRTSRPHEGSLCGCHTAALVTRPRRGFGLRAGRRRSGRQYARVNGLRIHTGVHVSRVDRVDGRWVARSPQGT
jgi:hypothetical protein